MATLGQLIRRGNRPDRLDAGVVPVVGGKKLSIEARLRLVGNATPSTRKQVLTELVRAGLAAEVDPQQLERGPPGGFCLLVFDRLTGEVLHELRAAGALGRQRVLAIALGGTTLESSDAWSLLQSGASDVVRWDESNPPARDVAARLQRWAEVDRMLCSAPVRQKLIGDSSNWIALLRQVVEVAAFARTSILLTGESGTGKELVAQLIHALDRQAGQGIVRCRGLHDGCANAVRQRVLWARAGGVYWCGGG